MDVQSTNTDFRTQALADDHQTMLARTKGWCDFLSTPNGFEHFYDIHEAARLDTR